MPHRSDFLFMNAIFFNAFFSHVLLQIVFRAKAKILIVFKKHLFRMLCSAYGVDEEKIMHK